MRIDYEASRHVSVWATWEVLTTTGHRAAAQPLLATRSDADLGLLSQVLLPALRLHRDGHERRVEAIICAIPQYVACWVGDHLRAHVGLV